MKKKEDSKVPEFQSLEKEREYWESHGPLAEGHEGRINRPKPGQKRSSYLAVRLTGEELTQLRDIAARFGVGPSTFARLLLASVIRERENLPKRVLTLDELKEMLLSSLSEEMKASMIKLSSETSVGQPPTMLILDPQNMRQAEKLTWQMLIAFLRILGFQVVTPEQEKRREIEGNRGARI